MTTAVTCRIIFALIFQNCRELLPVNYLQKEMSGGLIWLDAWWGQNQTCWPSSSVRNLALSSKQCLRPKQSQSSRSNISPVDLINSWWTSFFVIRLEAWTCIPGNLYRLQSEQKRWINQGPWKQIVFRFNAFFYLLHNQPFGFTFCSTSIFSRDSEAFQCEVKLYEMAWWDNMLQRLYSKHKCIKMHVHNFTPDPKTFVFATKYKPNVKISCCNNGSNENRQKTWGKKGKWTIKNGLVFQNNTNNFRHQKKADEAKLEAC